MWDASAILSGDPDQPGRICISLGCDPNFPLPLAIIECAADLDITIKIEKPDSDLPGIVIFDLAFEGRCLDLSELDLRMSAWQLAHVVLNKSLEEIRNERIAASGPPNPSGSDGSAE